MLSMYYPYSKVYFVLVLNTYAVFDMNSVNSCICVYFLLNFCFMSCTVVYSIFIVYCRVLF